MNYEQYFPKQTVWLQRYIDTITAYQTGHVDISGCYTEKHHIIPRWVYKKIGVPIDSTKENLVRVKYVDHIKLHIYLCKHYDTLKDSSNFFSASHAVKQLTTHKNQQRSSAYDQFLVDDQILSFLEKCKIASNEHNRQCRYRSAKKYEFNGEAHTLREWSVKTGIPYRNIQDRIYHKHWDIGDAISKPVQVNHSYYTINGITKDIAGWSRQYEINHRRVQERLRYGWDIMKALTTPVNHHRPTSK